MTTVDTKLNTLIAAYNTLIQGIDAEATARLDRAYGGIIRAGKGQFVENMTKHLVLIAWEDILHQSCGRIEMNKKKMPIGINDRYIERIQDPRIREYVQMNRSKLVYKFSTDVQVFIDGKLVLPIECKSYTENAMLKRILFDAELMKEAVGIHTYYLLQLESQLGGDYSALNEVTYGSNATHALLSHVDIELKIITLLKGDRKVGRPIHKSEFFKELKIGELQKAVDLFAQDLSKYVK